jgi:DNA excision repair protein ERCC-2
MNILFPHDEVRGVQKEFINDIIESIKDKKHLLAHAPTGIGKTAAILSSILPFILDKDMTLFFLTGRHTQHTIAVDTLKEIQKKHETKVKVVDFIGKKHMCNQPGSEILPAGQFYEYCRHLVENEECDFYENIYSKIGYSLDARKFVEKDGHEIENVGDFLKKAKETRLCPYELALLKTKKAKVIIADYYHVFNPSIREAFFKKSNKFLEKSVIIVDEAHNLPSRLRDMMSTRLSTLVIERARRESEDEQVREILNEIENRFNVLKEGVDEEKLIRKEDFEFEGFEESVFILEKVAESIKEVKKRSYIGLVAEFLIKWQGEDEGFVRYLEKIRFNDKEIFRLNYKCLDPSLNMEEVIDKSLLILMSGTLTPLEMYRDLLGFKREEVIIKEYENPFPEENRLNLIIPDTTTKYTKRSLEMYKLIGSRAASFSDLIEGNVIVFFPSYRIMSSVYDFFVSMGKKTILMERKGMTKEEKEELLNKFRSYKKVGSVLFAVSGGSFSEGVDLPGEELKGVIIVGLPLSKPDIETKSLIEYYDHRFSRGWDYAYMFPAMIRVIQGAGRCIRSEKDKGVIIYLDERYSLSNYFRCFPKDFKAKITKLPEEHIKKFFKN